MEIDIGDGDLVKGTAYFDLKPEFPCFGLFLSTGHALILKQREADGGSYTRIGTLYVGETGSWERFGQNVVETPVMFLGETAGVTSDQIFTKRQPWSMVTIM